MHDELDAGAGGAGAPPESDEANRAPDLTRRYDGDGIAVSWYAARCIHDAACVRAQPRVFNPRRRPWINASAADAEAVAAAVRACPTGALQYEMPNGQGEPVEQVATVRHIANGPVYVRGNIAITDEDGNVIRRGSRFALCQCGKSNNKPFCDNSHRARD